MSLDRCKTCEDIIDTDFDCGFYDFSYKANDMHGHCEKCRDDIYDKLTPAEQDQHERRVYG